MLTKQIWFGALAMALMTTAASALPIPMYKVVVLPGISVTYPQTAGSAAIAGQQGGVFVLERYSFACDPIPDPIACRANRTHAALWTQNGKLALDLNPRGYFSSTLTGMTNNMQVGFGYPHQPAYKQQIRALAWFGSAGSMIDLTPARFIGSMANAVDGFRVVGTGYVREASTTKHPAIRAHAIMWLGLDTSSEQPTMVVDLNPKGYVASEAFAVSNGYEAGYVYKTAASRHAYIWRGTAGNGIDYHPAGYADSYIVGFDGSQAVGAAVETKNGGPHAYLWNMRSTVFGVDLNGSGFTETVAAAVGHGKQVGWGELKAVNGLSSYHALVWSGTASSCVDLHAFLPRIFISSKAVAIAPDGSIVGIAIDKYNKSHAILWAPQI